MRRASLVLTLIAAAAAASSCDSTQPDRIEQKTASVFISALALAIDVDCFDVWEDTNNDFAPDLNTGRVQCFQSPQGQANQVPVPWRYSLVISVIREGNTTEELIATSLDPSDSIPDFGSLTPYDTAVNTGGSHDHQGTTYYLNGRQASTGSQLFVESLGIILGPPSVLGVSPTYDFTVNRGDTIIVRARKESVATMPGYLSVFPAETPPPRVQLEGRLLIGGQEVQPSGTVHGSGDDGASVYYSFTVK